LGDSVTFRVSKVLKKSNHIDSGAKRRRRLKHHHRVEFFAPRCKQIQEKAIRLLRRRVIPRQRLGPQGRAMHAETLRNRRDRRTVGVHIHGREDAAAESGLAGECN